MAERQYAENKKQCTSLIKIKMNCHWGPYEDNDHGLRGLGFPLKAELVLTLFLLLVLDPGFKKNNSSQNNF